MTTQPILNLFDFVYSLLMEKGIREVYLHLKTNQKH